MDGLEASRDILPAPTLSLNTLPPSTRQRAHRYNPAAVTLEVAGERCFSTVDDTSAATGPRERR